MAKAFSALIVGFVVAKYIPPEDLGLWATLNIAVTYSLLLQGGLINGLNLELPLSFGKGDNNEGIQLAGTVQAITVVTSLIVFAIGLIIFTAYPFENIKIQYGVLVITFFIIVRFYQNYLTSTFRSNNSFLTLSYIQLVDSIVNIVSLIFVIYYAYYGLMLKSVLVLLIYTVMLHFYRPIKVGWYLDMKYAKRLLKVGLPIFALGYIESIASTADKLILLAFSDITNVGLYTFGIYSITIFSLFSVSVATYVYPKLTFQYARTGDKLIIWEYVKKITIGLFFVQLPLALLGYYLLPFFIKSYFPVYVLSTTTMQILIFAGFFKGCVVGANALWSIKNWKYLTLFQLSYAFLLILLPYIGIQIFDNKIEGSAYGVLIANFLNFILGIYLTHAATHET